MIIAYAILLLVIIALILRRDLTALGRLPFRGGWQIGLLILGLFIAQMVLIIYAPGRSQWQMLVLVLSQTALVAIVLINRHIPGAYLFALGVALNTLVMVANGGWMPVSPEAVQYVHPERSVEENTRPPKSKNIILSREETNLWLLSDIIRVSLPWRRNVVSIGDVLLVAGAAQFIFQATARREKVAGYS